MNRHQRRVAEARGIPVPKPVPPPAPKFSPEEEAAGQELLAGFRWQQQPDPEDDRFTLLTLRVAGRLDEKATRDLVTGKDAFTILVQFIRGFLPQK